MLTDQALHEISWKIFFRSLSFGPNWLWLNFVFSSFPFHKLSCKSSDLSFDSLEGSLIVQLRATALKLYKLWTLHICSSFSKAFPLFYNVVWMNLHRLDTWAAYCRFYNFVNIIVSLSFILVAWWCSWKSRLIWKVCTTLSINNNVTSRTIKAHIMFSDDELNGKHCLKGR